MIEIIVKDTTTYEEYFLQKDHHISELRESSGLLLCAPDNEIIPLAAHSLPIMNSHHQQIEITCQSILDDELIVSVMTSQMARCSDREVIRLVQELNFYGE